MRTLLKPKFVAETRTYTFDFATDLAASETISTQSVTATVYSGTDSAPSSIISGSASAAGSVVSQKITGGTVGVIYQLACTITTSLSQTLVMSAYLAVLPPLA